MFHPALLVAALGYFVDVFDLWLYPVFRIASLTDLGYSGAELAQHSTAILNAQMIGMLLGGLVFGVLGDKMGRKTALFGSIIIYASATLFNAFVWDAESYTIARAISGFGLAGELGAGVTLTMEVMKKEQRGWAPTIIAGFGLLGAVAAGLIGDLVSWRVGYFCGGLMGFALFLLRLKVSNSGLFDSSRASDVEHGSLWMLLNNPERLKRYLLCILIGIPLWFVAGLLLTFAPEFATELKVVGAISPGHAVMYFALAMPIGDIVSGYFSQIIKSRRKALLLFLSLLLLSLVSYFTLHDLERNAFYALYMLLGFFVGYWAVLMATVTEQFGTNLRATAATTVPNFVRGSTVLMTLSLGALKPHYGLLDSAALIGGIVILAALLAAFLLPESFHKEMDFQER